MYKVARSNRLESFYLLVFILDCARVRFIGFRFFREPFVLLGGLLFIALRNGDFNGTA